MTTTANALQVQKSPCPPFTGKVYTSGYPGHVPAGFHDGVVDKYEYRLRMSLVVIQLKFYHQLWNWRISILLCKNPAICCGTIQQTGVASPQTAGLVPVCPICAHPLSVPASMLLCLQGPDDWCSIHKLIHTESMSTETVKHAWSCTLEHDANQVISWAEYHE